MLFVVCCFILVFVYAGQHIAMEVENNGHRVNSRQIPVYLVTVTLLPGAIDDPKILFGGALHAAYNDVLAEAHRHPHASDMVRMEIHHEDIKKNHGHFTCLNLPIRGPNGDKEDYALDLFVDEWMKIQQSDDTVHLNHGGLTLAFQFTLSGALEPLHNPANAHMGATKQRAKKGGMYVRRIYDDFYTKHGALKKTPSTAQGLCFPMAFLGCQNRRVFLHDDGNVWKVEETKAVLRPRNRHIPSLLNRLVWIRSREDAALIRTHAFHMYTFKNNYPHIVLFHPYKTITSFTQCKYEYKLDEAETEGALNAWVRAAEIIHEHVETTLGTPVDVHDFNTCVQAYANVFQVHIHILRVECQLQQTELFVPATNPRSMAHDVEDHIYVVFGDGDGNYQHCHAVCNRRAMLHTPDRRNEHYVLNYCDTCGTVSDGSNVSQREALAHMNACRLKGKVVKNSTEYFQAEYKSVCKKTLYKFVTRRDGRHKCRVCGDFTDTPRSHICRFPLPVAVPERPIPEINDSREHPNYWVYDIESANVSIQPEIEGEEPNLFRHRPNCICLRPVYAEEPRLHFHDATSFCEYVIQSPEFNGATIFAHNGGAYDHQFVIQYLEKQCVKHTVLCRPGSSHKYLEIAITREAKESSIYFKDFLMFMCHSLKEIAKSMNLPIQKGDFPHRFNNGKRDNYVGCFPPIDTDDDYFCLKNAKEASEIQELREWHEREKENYCTCPENINSFPIGDVSYACLCHMGPHGCMKPNWNFQQEILKYCWLDTDILAHAVRKFREEHISLGDEGSDISADWVPTPIDPLQYYTQAQAALRFFIQGIASSQNKVRPAVSERRLRSGFSIKAVCWLEKERRNLTSPDNAELPKIIHAGNARKEYWEPTTNTFVDGFAPYGGKSNKGEQIYEFLGCFYHGCPTCFAAEIANPSILHPYKKCPWSIVHEKTMDKLRQLREVYGEGVTSIWECEYDRTIAPLVTRYDRECANLMGDRDMFYGGRTEVFSSYARSTEDYVVEHHDVTSMYPYVCAHKMLPIGVPTIIFGSDCRLEYLDRSHPNAYFGYVRCRVIPHQGCVLGLLPLRDEGKLQFDLHPKTGVWFTEELYLAMERGYRVVEIYEVFHFDANERSDTLFRGYMSFFLRMKQESEGWKKAGAASENPSVEEQQQIIQRLYEENGCIGRMRADRVAKNPVKRAVAKLNLNCLWGKFAQQDEGRTNSKIVYTYQSWAKDIHTNPAVDQTSLRYREMAGGAYMCYYKTFHEHDRVNPYVNIWIASAVTAWARCILHAQMIVVGPERVLYCDTDSIVFLKRRDEQRQFIGQGLGKWTNESDEGDEILEFMGVAPKCYMKVERENLSGTMKAKGVRLTVSNREKTTPEVVKQLLQQEFFMESTEPRVTVQFDHFTIFANSTNVNHDYATVFSRYAKKIFQVVLSKRQMVKYPNQDLQGTLLNGGIKRLFLAPFSPQPLEENDNYRNIYS